LLVSLTTSPLSTFTSTTASYHQCFLLLFTHILAIPLLPNRLPLASLTEFSSRLPLFSLGVLAPSIPLLITNPSLSTPDSKISIIANLIAFTPPRYPTLPAAALDTYLYLLTTLMNALPINSLDPPIPGTKSNNPSSLSWAAAAADDDSDSESESHTLARVSIVSSFIPKPSPPPALDPRTQKRLSAIPDVKHLNALLSASHRHPSTQLSLVSFFLSLGTVWPARRERVLSTLVVYTGGGLVRELYRGFVRASPMGRDDNPGSLMGMPSMYCLYLLY
jgi:ubiquitin-protein ligase E3 C